MRRPLEDITVLDLTTALAGPFATLVLGGLGARVIKIENPARPDACRENAPYLGRDGATLTRKHEDDVSVSAINRLRNKLGVTLDLKHPEARAVFADLVRHADMLVENFSVGALDRMGAGYDAVHRINPRLVYCSITGFGREDAGSGKAMDTIIQALSGVMMTSGNEGDPPVRLGVPFADLTTPLFAVIGALAALHQAQSTGVGQHVDISMLGVMSALVAAEPFETLARCGLPQRTGLGMPRLAPFGVYPTSDGYLAICAYTDPFAHALYRAMGRAELVSDNRFSSRDQRVENAAALDAIIEAFTRARTTVETIAALDAFEVPCGAVRDPAEALRDPRVLGRGDTVQLAHPRYGPLDDVLGMGLPIAFSDSEAGLDQPPPGVGEHNDAVYSGILGYSKEQIETLKSSGAL
jgi:crotonobetainyl-CoA:carnitine CoA-transferase CaiB-like acyl-CoA transferase